VGRPSPPPLRGPAWLTPSGAVSFDGGGFYILYLLIAAFFAGVVSLVWGVAAGSARAVRRRRANG